VSETQFFLGGGGLSEVYKWLINYIRSSVKRSGKMSYIKMDT